MLRCKANEDLDKFIHLSYFQGNSFECLCTFFFLTALYSCFYFVFFLKKVTKNDFKNQHSSASKKVEVSNLRKQNQNFDLYLSLILFSAGNYGFGSID